MSKIMSKMIWVIPILYLGALALGQEDPPLSAPQTPTELGVPGERDLGGKRLFPDWRYQGASLERVNPRPVFQVDPKGGAFRIALPYVQVSRKDMALLRLNDPDCPEYDLRSFKEVLEKAEFSDFRPWREGANEEGKMNALKERAKRMEDGQCPDASWSLPYSSVLATQFVAGKLKRAWERFEDRYFWRTVTDLNNPVYWFPFCAVGIGLDSFSGDKRAPIDHVPPGSIPPELGALLTEDILNLVSNYKKEIPTVSSQGGEREATPNWVPESEGQFRKPLYLPFIPTIPPGQFCDNLPFKLPVLYIPAIAISVCGITVWTSPDYPDRPWLFDEGEANARVQGAIRYAYEVYYRDYLLDALTALLPLSTLERNFATLGETLSSLGSGSLPEKIEEALTAMEGLMYFPMPWQAPILGGGAVITPVYDFLYPDFLRTGTDILTIYDMVGSLLKGESLSFMEKVALGLYYLDPVLTYLDQPLLPGVVDTTLRETPAGQSINLIYSSLRTLAEQSLLAFRNGVEGLATSAFGNEQTGKAFAAGVRTLLKPIEEIFASREPRYFVRATLRLLSSLDSFLFTFTKDKGYGFRNRVNGITLSPGLWRFEEIKRVFPPSSPLTQRIVGYSSFFASWGTLTATIIPDFSARWANPVEYGLALVSRLVGYWHLPIRIDICFGGVSVRPDTPRYMPLPPYFMPFVGERFAWGWFSVPEGYVIPLAKGIPGSPIPKLGSDHPLAGKENILSGGEGWIVDFYERVVLRLGDNVKVR